MVIDRRGEAHLWLLLEEALAAATRGGAEVWEVRRSFATVAEALALTEVVPRTVTSAIREELDDALAVRGLLEAASFTGRPFPTDEARTPSPPASGAVGVWLEAEVERHLDLVSAYDPVARSDAGLLALRALAGPVRAFEAAGVLGVHRRLVDDLAASLTSAGFDAGRVRPGREGRVRREWVRFLRDRPPLPPGGHQPPSVSEPRTVLGTIDGRTVRVDRVAWSEAVVDVGITTRSPSGPGREDWVPWHARAVDERGRLHLAAAGSGASDGGTTSTFRLRPGLPEGARRIELRISRGGERAEGSVLL